MLLYNISKPLILSSILLFLQFLFIRRMLPYLIFIIFACLVNPEELLFNFFTFYNKESYLLTIKTYNYEEIFYFVCSMFIICC
jgi:hypothetical protein